jgi:hypothetical protein
MGNDLLQCSKEPECTTVSVMQFTACLSLGKLCISHEETNMLPFLTLFDSSH